MFSAFQHPHVILLVCFPAKETIFVHIDFSKKKFFTKSVMVISKLDNILWKLNKQGI